MRSQVIPAQITTVEDKIAGDFSFTQIMLLLLPVLLASAIYAFMPPNMSLVVYKLVLASVLAIICITLAVRVKGRLVASWLLVFARYNLRPKFYIYNKNTTLYRSVVKPEVLTSVVKETAHQKKQVGQINTPNIRDILQLNHILDTTDFNFIYKTSKKGGLNVAFEKISR